MKRKSPGKGNIVTFRGTLTDGTELSAELLCRRNLDKVDLTDVVLTAKKLKELYALERRLKTLPANGWARSATRRRRHLWETLLQAYLEQVLGREVNENSVDLALTGDKDVVLGVLALCDVVIRRPYSERDPDAVGASLEAALALLKSGKRPRRRGGRRTRIPPYVAKDIYRHWRSRRYTTYAQLATDLAITEAMVRTAVNSEAKREKRSPR